MEKRTVLVCTVLVRTVLVRTVLVRTVLVRTVLVCTVLVCTVLVRTVLVRTAASDILILVSVQRPWPALAISDVLLYRWRSAPPRICPHALVLKEHGEHFCSKREQLDGGFVGIKLFVVTS